MTWGELHYTFASSNLFKNDPAAFHHVCTHLGWYYTAAYDIFSAHQTLQRRSVHNQLKEDIE